MRQHAQDGKVEVLVVASSKGGTGKSSTVASLAYALSRRGMRVAAIDLDVNANLSRGLGRIEPVPGQSIGSVICDPSRHLKEIVVRDAVPGVDLIPAVAADTMRAKLYIQSELPRIMRLRELIDDLADDYDVFLLDTPGELGVMLSAAVYAATWAIVPIPPKRDPILDCSVTVDFINQMRSMGSGCEVLGLLPTLVDRLHAHATKAGLELAAHVAEDKGVPLFRTRIPIESKFNEAELLNLPIGIVYPTSRTAIAYDLLADEVCGRMTENRNSAKDQK